jgi:outer membrane receptor for ferrienterochelin and colicins
MPNALQVSAAFLLAALLAAAQPAGSGSAPEGGGSPNLETMPIEQLLDMQIQTASLRRQTLQDAPASVTVVTSEDIRRFGYGTLGEVLAGVRGFYLTTDGPFRFAGVRGFSLPSDNNTRLLVLINGHHLTDNVFGSMYYFGNDFPLDLGLIDRIEIVRGPTSAVYGSNGIFATINIIIRTPDNAARVSVEAEVGAEGAGRLAAFGTAGAPHTLRLLGAASGLLSRGRTVEFPGGSMTGATGPVGVPGIGEESGYRFFGQALWNNWTVTALFGQHKSMVPSGWFQTQLGDTGTIDVESRNYVEAAWNRSLGQNSVLRWRSYYDQFRYDGVYQYGPGQRIVDGAAGDWVGSELVYNRETGRLGTLTAGSEVSMDLRNLQYHYEEEGAGIDAIRSGDFRFGARRATAALFGGEEFRLAPAWSAYVGARADCSTRDALVLTPRLALIYKPGSASVKAMYGRAFRNPSPYERQWSPNSALRAEHVDTYEVAWEQRLRGTSSLMASAYHYRLDRLIVGVEAGPKELSYKNGSRARANGFELEWKGQPVRWLDAAASLALQRVRGATSGERLPNSPGQVAQFRAAVPLARQRVLLAVAARYMSSRFGIEDRPAVKSALVVDTTLTLVKLSAQADLQVGVRNLFNSAYMDPLGAEHASTVMPGARRTAFLRLRWRHD